MPNMGSTIFPIVVVLLVRAKLLFLQVKLPWYENLRPANVPFVIRTIHT